MSMPSSSGSGAVQALDENAGLSALQVALESAKITVQMQDAVALHGFISGGFWSIPRVKFAVRGLLEVAFLIQLSYILIFAPYQRLGLAETTLSLWAGALMVDEYYQFLVKSQGSLRTHLADHWNKVDFTKISLLLTAGALRALACALAAAPFASDELSDECAKMSRWVLSFSALACTLRLFAMLSLQQEHGVLFLSVLFMLHDILRFFLLLALAALGFGLVMAGVINSSSCAPSPNEPWAVPRLPRTRPSLRAAITARAALSRGLWLGLWWSRRGRVAVEALCHSILDHTGTGLGLRRAPLRLPAATLHRHVDLLPPCAGGAAQPAHR